MKIFTIFEKHPDNCLSKPTQRVDDLDYAREVAHKLLETMATLSSAAGLAAPQIGIPAQVFIYTWNRTMEEVETVINPKILSYSDERYGSWEACFSAMQEDGVSQAAFINRAESVVAEFINLNGDIVTKEFTGFAAKVFQHEYDHLQGIENVNRPDAEVKSFVNKQEMFDFLLAAKKDDSIRYIKPLAA